MSIRILAILKVKFPRKIVYFGLRKNDSQVCLELIYMSVIAYSDFILDLPFISFITPLDQNTVCLSNMLS